MEQISANEIAESLEKQHQKINGELRVIARRLALQLHSVHGFKWADAEKCEACKALAKASAAGIYYPGS